MRNVRVRVRNALAALGGFLSPAAFEQRARDRERRKLREELENLDKLRKLIADREPVIVDRLAALAKEDIAAALPTASGYGMRWGLR